MSHPAVYQQSAIKDYALIGDCRTAGLISREGSLDWLCLPKFSSPSLFARLLDPDGGHFSIKPSAPLAVHRRYLPGTAILKTTFVTATGAARLIDLCPIVDSVTTLAPMREVLRIIEGISGRVDLQIEFAPRPDYARARPKIRRQRGIGWRCAWSNQLILLNASTDLNERGESLCGTTQVQAGQRQYVSLSYVQGDIGSAAALGADADSRYENTASWWRNWVSQCQFQGPEEQAVVRSALTLKLLTFCLSGAVVAAPTTSLPEAIGGERNWDYRYCWLRDAGLTMETLLSLGFHDEASAYLGWLLHTTRLTRPRLKVLYDVYGRSYLGERHLEHFDGYRNSRPVRVGNDAIRQLQLDVHGQVIAAAESFATAGYPLDSTEAQMLAGFGDVICERWREPDNGMWEIPGPRRHYTFSKVMCWVALTKLLALHERGAVQFNSRESRYRRIRDEIAECIETRGFNRHINSYTGELDGDSVDAALLLMAFFGYRDARDPRMVSTYERIQKELGRNGLLYRYRPGFDGLNGEEGAFGICSFMAVNQLAERGLLNEAEQYFGHLQSMANDLGLFGEEIAPHSGDALGNFPHGFTHVGLIQAALSIARARRRARP